MKQAWQNYETNVGNLWNGSWQIYETNVGNLWNGSWQNYETSLAKLWNKPGKIMKQTRPIATSIDNQGRLHTFTWFPAHYQALMKSSSLLSTCNSLWYAIGLRQRQEWKLEEFTGVVWHRGVGNKRRKRFWGNAKVRPTFGEDAQSRFRPFHFHIYCFSLDLGSLFVFFFLVGRRRYSI